MAREPSRVVAREFLVGLWKVLILHRAGTGGVYGEGLLGELFDAGHRLSPGTLYPILARMVSRGWLQKTGQGGRQVYTLTPSGDEVLTLVRVSLGELGRELETRPRRPSPRHRSKTPDVVPRGSRGPRGQRAGRTPKER